MPEDFEACLMLHAAAGIKGLNGYILTGGPNVPGTGVTTDYYDYHAPIGANNEIRSTYAVLERFHRFIEEHPGLLEASPVVDFQIAVPWDGLQEAGTPKWGNPTLPGTIQPTELWRFVHKGVLTSALAGGMQPQFTNICDADISKVLLLPCHGAMSAGDQKKIVEFLKKGGRVLCLPLLPVYDENYKPCTILSEFVNGTCSPFVSVLEHQPVPAIGEIQNVWCNEGTSCATSMPEQAEILGRDVRNGKPLCWHTSCGQGEFIFSGMAWTHVTNAHSHALQFLLQKMGMIPYLTNSNPFVFALVRGNLLFLCNLSTCRHDVTITLQNSGRSISREIPPMKVEVISICEN